MAKRLPPGAKPVIDAVAGAALGPAGAMAVKFLSSVAEPILQHMEQRRERRAEAFVGAFTESGYPQETSSALLQAEIANAPGPTKDAIIDTLKALDDAVSDSVAPSLALLGRDYIRAGRPKDRFFLGALRMLRDLEEAEYDALRGLVIALDERWAMERHSDNLLIQRVERDGSVILNLDRRSEIAWQPEYSSFFESFTSAGFASLATGWAGATEPGDTVYEGWNIRREPWSRLVSLLPRPTPPAST